MFKKISMDWQINGAHRESGAEYWTAGEQASFIKWGTRGVIWEEVSLDLRYSRTGGGLAVILDPWYVVVDEADFRISLHRYIRGSLCAGWDIDLADAEWLEVKVQATLSAITISVNGQHFEYRAKCDVPMTSLQVHFSPWAHFAEPKFEATEAACPYPSPRPYEPKALEMTVDFWDDMLLAPFNQAMLDTMFGTMAEYGTSKAYWIHHGKRGMGGAWTNMAADNMQGTFDLLNSDDYLPAAVEAAHKNGIPLIGIFKPFDTTMCHYTFPVPAGQGETDALGGRLDQMFDFPAGHPEICQRRRVTAAGQGSVQRLTITSRKDLPASIEGEIEIYLSADNATYTRYRGPLNIELSARQIDIRDLAIDSEFVILVLSPQLAVQVQNTLPLLVQAYDAAGNTVEFTYGITPRLQHKAEYHLDQHPELLDFREHGINFDCAGHGMPSVNCCAEKIHFELFSPQQSHDWLGLAFSQNAQAPGVLSEAEPGAQRWWLGIIGEMLEAGVDGVEIRLMCHANVIDWEAYGFNPPVVDEYRRRYGVDITREEFSRKKFRALRGEFFTAFLRQASELVRAHGKSFHLHIEDMRQGAPAESLPMEMEMQWRTWLEEELCDCVTLKANNFWSHDSAFGRELLAACKAQNIPVSFAPFIHSAFSANNGREMLDYALSSPFDAFNIYEFASLFAFDPDGSVSVIDENIIDWLQSYQWRRQVAESLSPSV